MDGYIVCFSKKHEITHAALLVVVTRQADSSFKVEYPLVTIKED
jgi:hypothetical protein